MVKREGHAAYGAGRDFKAYPLARGRQGAHVLSGCGFIWASGDEVVAPVGPVPPVGIIPSQHDFTRWVVRVQIDIGEQGVTASDLQGFHGVIE